MGGEGDGGGRVDGREDGGGSAAGTVRGCARHCVATVAPTEHISTGIYLARYICTGQECSHADEALVSAQFSKTRSK